MNEVQEEAKNIKEKAVVGKKENLKKLGRSKKPFNFLWVVLFVNVFMIGGSLYLLYDLPKKALKLKEAKVESLRIQESSKVDMTGLEIPQNKQNWEKLKSYFKDEVGVIGFITDLENLKKGGVIKDMSFVSQDVVADRTNSSGIPFVMQIEGDWEKVNSALDAFYKLPYIVRVINVNATTLEDGTINYKYGGFIYVSDELGKNR